MPDTINSDEKRYKQILYNLVGNALKFTLEGTIDILVSRENEILMTRVRDTGVGIEAEQLEKLF